MKPRRLTGRLCALTLVPLLGWQLGCAQTFDATTLGIETIMASDVTQPAVGQPFKIDKKAVYLLWGITTASTPSLRKALAAQVTGNAKVVDLRIKVRSRWSDVLFTILTVGLIVPRSVTFEGVIVQQP